MCFVDNFTVDLEIEDGIIDQTQDCSSLKSFKKGIHGNFGPWIPGPEALVHFFYQKW